MMCSIDKVCLTGPRTKCYVMCVAVVIDQQWRRQRALADTNKSKGNCLDTCYSAAYMSQTRDQQRFTLSEVAAD